MNSIRQAEAIQKLVGWLFASGNSVSVADLRSEFGDQWEYLVEHGQILLEQVGLQIVISGDDVQIITAPDHSDWLQARLRAPLRAKLTPAGRETLATVAYAGSVSKDELDYLRGVNTYGVLRTLALGGYLEEIDGKYQTTTTALGLIGVKRAEQLPDWELINTKLTEQLRARADTMVK